VTTAGPMTTAAPMTRQHGNAYNIFILVLTVFSLGIMVLLVLPIPQAERDLLIVYDNVICLIFLGDFAFNLAGSRPRSAYFIGARGWLDLLGSVPALGLFQYTGLLRLARLSRLTRISRLLRGSNRKALIEDVLHNRGEYATFITILSAGIVMSVASVLVLLFEETAPDGNIRTGGDALWWALVTITTVGYGDRFPVTFLGRTTGFFVMLAGVGIIGALASILASVLVSSDEAAGDGTPAAEPGAAVGLAPPAASPAAATSDAIAAELGRLRDEIAALRTEIHESGAQRADSR
jgi:voltage-gated potassium channel